MQSDRTADQTKRKAEDRGRRVKACAPTQQQGINLDRTEQARTEP